jgi:acyl carrier protein
MTPSDFCRQLDELFEVDEGTIQPTDELQQIPGWSSLTFMGLIALVDEEYEVTLKPALVLKAASVADLASLIADGVAADSKAA